MGKPLTRERMDDFGPSGPTQCPFCFINAEGKDLKLEEDIIYNNMGQPIKIKHSFHCVSCDKEIMSVIGRAD